MSSRALLDDPEFLAELEKLDVGPAVSRAADKRFVDYARPTIEEWAHEHELELPTIQPLPVEGPDDAPAADRIVAAVTMLGGTLAGAALAVAMFHSHVARILGALGN